MTALFWINKRLMHNLHFEGTNKALSRFTARLTAANPEIHSKANKRQKPNHVKLRRSYTTSLWVFGFLGRQVKAL